MNQTALFDAHFHIIDHAYPLTPNQGYLPEHFSCADYLKRMAGCSLAGGVVVSGSFQGFDQGYLLAALQYLGKGYVGVTQLPVGVSDSRLDQLHSAGVRAVRFNLFRGGSEQVSELDRFARRVYDRLGWHVELYLDGEALDALYSTLKELPALSIDHLGLTKQGERQLLNLAEKGGRVKACGFGRLDFSVADRLRDLYAANPNCLMFGSDLPSTRAPRAYDESDMILIQDTLGETAARQVLCENAQAFYRRST